MAMPGVPRDGGDTVAQSAQQITSEANSTRFENAADRLILERADPGRVARFIQSLPSGLDARGYALLLCTASARVPEQADRHAIGAGSYFASRLMARGISLPGAIEECMYALADAVRSASIIEAIRWRFVLTHMPAAATTRGTAMQLVRQSGRAIHALACLTDARAVAHEGRVLDALRTDPWRT